MAAAVRNTSKGLAATGIIFAVLGIPTFGLMAAVGAVPSIMSIKRTRIESPRRLALPIFATFLTLGIAAFFAFVWLSFVWMPTVKPGSRVPAPSLMVQLGLAIAEVAAGLLTYGLVIACRALADLRSRVRSIDG